MGLFVLTFILGSFLDQNVSAALFSRDNTFGLVLSVIGTTPGYGCLALIGGGFLSLGLKKDCKTWLKVIYIIVSIIFVGLGIFYAGREFFGPNGFVGVTKEWVGYFIEMPIMGALAFLGYYLGKKSDNPRLVIVLIIFAIGIFFALIPGVTLLKAIFHRPRYRMITRMEVEAFDLIAFHPWWQRCGNWNAIMKDLNEKISESYPTARLITDDEFKSFPSGHVGTCGVLFMLATMLPAINSKYKKFQIPAFYIGLGWTLIIAFARIWVGAHFLSDVSMGALLSIIFTLVLYYATYKSKLVYPKEAPQVEEKPAEVVEK